MTYRPIVAAIPWLAACVPFAMAAGIGAPQQTAQAPVYEGDVQTTLKAHCGNCHAGPDATAGLDLTTFASLMKGGTSGKVVKPGDAENSLLVIRLEGRQGMPQMPFGFKPLAPEKIKAIRAWIDAGCKSSGGPAAHWAYTAPKMPAVPVVKEKAWVRNPVDAFILERLEAAGLKHSKEAAKETLVRRLYLDLIGLPPSPKEVQAFVADTSKGAYEKLVDRLLGNPHFGERMARPWLDLARYADSDGYEKDLNRSAWKYRDWVINAFNKNMPYDEFTVEQLAGDLLPNATLDQQVATGFNRNTMFNSEGGVDQMEAHFNVVLDRVGTTATVWLGSTLQCARCHDHKYDPFTQKDFYKLFAVFDNSVVVPTGDSKIGEEKWQEPSIEVPTPEQAAKRDALKAEQAKLDSQLKSPGPDVEREFDAWLAKLQGGAAWTFPSAQVEARSFQPFTRLDDGSFLATGVPPPKDEYTVSLAGPLRAVTGIRVEALPDPSLPKNGPGRASSGNFSLSKVEANVGGTAVTLVRATTSFTQQGYDAQRTIAGDPDNGWAIYNEAGKVSELLLEPDKPVDVPDGSSLTVVLKFLNPSWPEHEIGRFRVSVTALPEPFVLPNALRKVAGDPAAVAKNRAALLTEFERRSPATSGLVARQQEVQQQLAALQASIPTALVLQEKPVNGPLKANVHIRGEFLKPGDEVESGPPAILAPKPSPEPFNRLSLARWLVDRQNPLTARVEVNRLWEMVFGRGLVETSEDFGTQGARPSHPKLLDWLAVTYMDSGWDTKALLKTIVTSSTYRQVSDATPDLLEKDPQNVLLARASRFRLEAETVRDNMLSIGGLLADKIGGPSVYPSQPAAVWDTPYNGQQWMTSQGPDKYRRGLYTFWKRSAPYPSFLAMDATSRETCTVRRMRTNTPLQALALLNDEVAMDAAKGLAKRMLDGGATVAQRLQAGFRLCTCRQPSDAELKTLAALYAKLVDHYAKDPDSAHKLAETPEQAALVMVANTLLNLDETISRT